MSLGQLTEMESERLYRFPAAFVAFMGMPVDSPRVIGARDVQEGTMSWSVIVTAESMRGLRAGRKGERGAYQIAKAIMEEVLGWEIQDGWFVYLVDFRPIDLGKELAVATYEILLAHNYDLDSY